MSLNVLHVCLSHSWGGLEMAVSKWNQILAEHGHDNFNICSPGSPLAEDLKQNQRKTEEWNHSKYFSPSFTLQLRKFVKTNKIDVVVLQNLRDLWIVSPALYGLKNVQLVGFAQMLLAIKKTDFLHRLVYGRLNHLLALTDWQINALLPYLPVAKNKYKTVPNFVDTQQFHPDRRNSSVREQLGFATDDFIISVIGRIDEQKGQMELLQAFDSIASQYPKSQLLIVGEPTLNETRQENYFLSLKQYAKQSSVAERIHFLPFQKDTHNLFANIDLFVLPSHEETFGYVVVEAMASGTAVLATEAGGPPEILDDGKAGFLCPPKNSQVLAEKLSDILANDEDRFKKANLGLQRARQVYDRQAVYKRFIQIIQDL